MREQWVEDAIYWDLTDDQYVAWLRRLSAYYGRRSVHFEAQAKRAHRKMIIWAVVALLWAGVFLFVSRGTLAPEVGGGTFGGWLLGRLIIYLRRRKESTCRAI